MGTRYQCHYASFDRANCGVEPRARDLRRDGSDRRFPCDFSGEGRIDLQ
jgi:hypothetical protein